MSRNSVILALSALLLVSACDDGFDTERPLAVIQSPVSGQTVNTAEGIPLQVLFTDNGNLLQYKMRLEGIDSLNGIAKDTMLRMVYIGGLSGSSLLFDEHIPLPDSTFNGHYRIIVTCIDDDGNESYPDTASVRIANVLDSIPPVIILGGLPEDTLRFGQGFTLSGIVSDETSLNRFTFRMANTDGSFTRFEHQATAFGDNSQVLDGFGGWFQVDSAWTEGTYSVYITAWDSYSGVSHTSYFEVKP